MYRQRLQRAGSPGARPCFIVSGPVSVLAAATDTYRVQHVCRGRGGVVAIAYTDHTYIAYVYK